MFGFGNVNEGANEERVEFNRAYIEWYAVEDVLRGAMHTERGIILPIAEGVNLEVNKSTRGGNDYGAINVFGFIINVTFPMGKNGHFLSFPQYARKGGFSYHALCVDKDFHTLVKNLIAVLYEEVGDVEGEETK